MIFLGQASNYSAGQALRHLFAVGTKRNSEKLRSELAQRYLSTTENVALYHSGRSALTVAFQSLVKPGAPIILPGLTCIAVVRAIKAAKCVPVFVDIDPKTYQYDYKSLENTLENQKSRLKSPKSIDKNDNLCYNGIIVAQNTFGLPLDVEKVERLAEKYHFAIVEDLAHSAGRFYPGGREIGTVGSAAVLSFGKGKAIDTICGGALVLRNTTKSNVLTQPVKKPPLSTRLRDRWYPIFGGISRLLWGAGLGRAFLAGLVRFRWVERSADTALDPEVRLTHWQAKLAAKQLARLPKTPLREPKLVKDRDQLLEKLSRSGYYFYEIWYDTPVSPVRYAAEADFPTETCPNTVKIADHVINLPTWYTEKRLEKARKIINPYEIDQLPNKRGENA